MIFATPTDIVDIAFVTQTSLYLLMKPVTDDLNQPLPKYIIWY